MVIAGRDSDPDRARHYRIVAAAQLVETCAASRMPIRSPGRMPRLDSADRGSGVCTGASSARIGSRPLSQQAYHSLRQLPGLDGPAFVDRRSRRRACRAGRAGCILLATRDLDDAFDKLRGRQRRSDPETHPRRPRLYRRRLCRPRLCRRRLCRTRRRRETTSASRKCRPDLCQRVGLEVPAQPVSCDDGCSADRSTLLAHCPGGVKAYQGCRWPRTGIRWPRHPERYVGGLSWWTT